MTPSSFAFQQPAADTDFDVAKDNFAHLEIRPAEGFYYFYDIKSRRLIKDFILRSGPRVDTMCGVLLVRKVEAFTPRLTFWKKDKTKSTSTTIVPSQPQTCSIKARVSVGDCYEGFWRLIDFLRTCKDVGLPPGTFHISEGPESRISEALEGHDKAAVLAAVKTLLGSDLTERDVQMLLDRRRTLHCFDRLLTDPIFFEEHRLRLGIKGKESVWQRFFEENTWIFGYGLLLVACEGFSDERLEQITTGSNVFTGGGKRSDALMRTKGFIQTLLFAEIKKHDTPLLRKEPYRRPDIYQVSEEISGAVSQVQKTAFKAVKGLEVLHRARTPGGVFQFEVSTVKPRQVVIAGNLTELFDYGEINLERWTSFELFRRSHQEVEILTYDELYARSKFIVESQQNPSP